METPGTVMNSNEDHVPVTVFSDHFMESPAPLHPYHRNLNQKIMKLA